MKKSTNDTNRGPGRPKYQPKFPRTDRWTFDDFEAANGVNPKTGKGENCTRLTLNKYLRRNLNILSEDGKTVLRSNPKSDVVRLKDVLADPNSKKGLGRRQYVYTLRSKLAGRPARKNHKVHKTTDVTVDLSQATKDYEAAKAALLTPDPVPAPALTADPVPETACAPSPVTQASAPVAPAVITPTPDVTAS